VDSGSPLATMTWFALVVTCSGQTNSVQNSKDGVDESNGKFLFYHLDSPLLDDLELLSVCVCVCVNAYEFRVNLHVDNML
jgi:hypothetical protein